MGADQLTFKMTKPRKVILEELRKMHNHPTADQLYEQVRTRLPRVSLATIYRNLDLMVKDGLVRQLASECGQRRYDGDLQTHWHVRCMHCNSIDDVFHLPQEPSIAGVQSRTGYKILGHRLELVGICPACR